MESARRAFLFGLGIRQAAANSPIRPPWAVDEARFPELCSRCGDCIAACPTHLLTEGSGGFPEADFRRGHCTFCTDCVKACRKAALNFQAQTSPWSLLSVVGKSCLSNQGVLCRTCGEACEPHAIRFDLRSGGMAQPQVDASTCTGCGECIASCPTQALTMQNRPAFAPQAQGMTV
jgi:ferredoxin-type protein NapF